MRDSFSLRVGAAKQCCQQGLTSTPSSISLTQYQHCTKLHIIRKPWKRKNQGFPPPELPTAAKGRITCVLSTQRTVRLQWFGSNWHKVPPVCSNMGWSPLTIKPPRFYSRCCNRNWLHCYLAAAESGGQRSCRQKVWPHKTSRIQGTSRTPQPSWQPSLMPAQATATLLMGSW